MVFDGVGTFAFFDRFAEVILIRKLLLGTQLMGHWRMKRSGRERQREQKSVVKNVTSRRAGRAPKML